MPADQPRIVATRRVYKGWNRVDVATVEAAGPGGTRRLEREIVDHGDAAVVLVIDRRRDVAILVRQWRAPLIRDGSDPFLLEVCAGILDPGESAEEAVRREAEEEIGVRLGAVRKVGTVVPSAGTLTERMHLFIAEVSDEDRTEGGGGNPHEGEDIEVVELPLPQLFAMARNGELVDAKTLILVQRLMLEAVDGENRTGRP